MKIDKSGVESGIRIGEKGTKADRKEYRKKDKKEGGKENGRNNGKIRGEEDEKHSGKESRKKDIREDRKEDNYVDEGPGFELLKRVVTEITGFNCEQYKEAHFRRRINVRLRATNAESYEEYLRLLKKNSAESEQLINVLTINVSEFFRNPETFRIIEKEIIPLLINYRSDSLVKSIRIWSAGCATGEEIYSLAILLHKTLGSNLGRYRVSLIGTDIDDLSLEKARKGVYHQSVLKNIDASIQRDYFIKQGDMYQISDELRSMVRFKRHDLISESCTNRFDIIICRNVMIYFKKEIQEQLQLNFYHALNKEGFFVIGKAETLLGTASNRFKPYNARERLYIK